MSWLISIINIQDDNRLPLGSREEVIAVVANALPGIVLECPPIPPQDILDIMPPILRESALNPDLEATYEVDDLHIRFCALNQPVLDWINAEVRGNDDPSPVLASLCGSRNWSVVDVDNQIVDLAKTSDSAWERFRKWRDFAFQQAKLK